VPDDQITDSEGATCPAVHPGGLALPCTGQAGHGVPHMDSDGREWEAPGSADVAMIIACRYGHPDCPEYDHFRAPHCASVRPGSLISRCTLDAGHPDTDAHQDAQGREWGAARCTVDWGSAAPSQRCTRDAGHGGPHQDEQGSEWVALVETTPAAWLPTREELGAPVTVVSELTGEPLSFYPCCEHCPERCSAELHLNHTEPCLEGCHDGALPGAAEVAAFRERHAAEAAGGGPSPLAARRPAMTMAEINRELGIPKAEPGLISTVGTLTPEEMATLTVARDRVALPPFDDAVSVHLVGRLVAIVERLAGITP
jgi:hypothetical protein